MNLTAEDPDMNVWGASKEIIVFCIVIKYKIFLILSNTNFVKINKSNIMIMLKCGYEYGYSVRTINSARVTIDIKERVK